jgi:peptide/nickel transport system permease protein
MKLRYFIIKRLLLQVIVIFGVITLAFVAIKSIPTNPIAALIGLENARDEELVKAVMKVWKLDRPVWEQYFWYVSNVLRGEFGTSIWSRGPVISDLAYRFPATVELAVVGFIIAMAIAIPAGIISAVYRDKIVDHAVRVYSVAGISGPNWWWGIILLLVFYYFLGFGGSGRLSIGTEIPPTVTGMYLVDSLLAGRLDIFFDALEHILLPAFAIGITSCGLTSRLIRSSMLEVLRQDYIRTARMKGLPERVVIYRHALRNALIAPITYMGFLFGTLLGGSVFIEVIFSWNGMGWYLVNAVFAADYPAIQGTTIIMAIIYSTANLIVDLLYGVIDPRVRLR